MIKPQKLPFSGTHVNPEKTKGEIITLLKKFGVTDYLWKEEMGTTELAFKTEVELEGQLRTLTVIIKPPLLVETKRVWDESKRMSLKKQIPNYSQSYRIILNYLKAKLTAIAIGIVRFEEEFLADILVGNKRLIDVIKQEAPQFLLPEKRSVDEEA